MSRLPQPSQPKRVRLVVSDAELYEMGVAAAQSRLSVASFARAGMAFLLKKWPEHLKEIVAVAQEIEAATPADQARPGRPPKSPPEKRGKKK
jgi:hypothetical protein